MKRFLIISHRRTGSNLLVSLLNSHPNISCYGEVFRNKFNVEKNLRKVDKHFQELSHRIENTKELFQQIEKRQNKRTLAWGFKLMPHQVENKLPEILDFGFDVALILKRPNKLAQYSSDLIASVTGQGVAGRNTDIKTAKVTFHAKGFQRFIEEIDYQYSFAEGKIKTKGVSILNLDYVNLQKIDTHEGILKKLEVPIAQLVSHQRKRNDSVIINRFSNIDTVRRHLFVTGQNHLMIETGFSTQ